MNANITVTLKHETGRTETIPNARRAGHTDESTIEVEYLMSGGFYTDEYDGLSWEIESVTHTETEIGR